MTHRRLLVLALLLLAATATLVSGCVTEEPLRAGSVEVCFYTPDGNEEESFPADLEEVVDGTVVQDVPASEANVDMACNPTRVLQVEADEEVWSVAYRVIGPDEADITPDVGFQQGQAIKLTLKRMQGWGTYEAFAAEAADGNLLAMNDGYGTELPAGAVEGLSVTQGDAYDATESSSCGKRVGHTLLFDAESTTELRSGDRGTVELASGPVEAMNVATWTYEEVTCTDTWGPSAWMVYRGSAE